MDFEMEIGSIASGMPTTDSVSAPVDADAFRSVMRQLVGSVAVITTEGNGTLHGFTATAVCSVCAAPPTILIVVNKSARTHPYIDRKGIFAVNILADDQKEIAQHFASKGEDQFSSVGYALSAHGVPFIDGAVAHLECEIEKRVSIGTHTVFVARVVGTGVEARAPLIYHDARYGLVCHI
jgi:flavin reductase (DIM6/NTAB) family NADH-FMN oxidoreductase RutF